MLPPRKRGTTVKKEPQVQDSVTNDPEGFGRGWFGVNNVQNREDDPNAEEAKNRKPRRG